MIINKYTKHSIFSLPLIFDHLLSLQELKDSDFVNMFVCDLNHPILSNHIFLVFHNLKDILLDKLKTHELYYSNYTIVIESTKYTVVVFSRGFTIYNTIDKTSKGLYNQFSYENKLRIYSFWVPKTQNLTLHSCLFNAKCKTDPPVCENITLEDKRKVVA